MQSSRSSCRLLRHLVIGSVLLVAACSSRIATHGNLPDPERLAEVVPGQIAKGEVAEILGSPSSIAAFNEETWYYISERKETKAFLAPDVTERKVVIVRFDDKGIVSSVETLGLEDGRNVELVERSTPTAGNEMTILEQVLGNMGRFNKADTNSATNTE
ncbi:MAG: outer membrane protein assembly factor BamE [Rhodospirillales bacterium]|nr:outer membrane protein assembly factor BamE [Rhodospirillales bacterium]